MEYIFSPAGDKDFKFFDLSINFGMLHDKKLDDITLEDTKLTLLFDNYKIYKQDFTDLTYYNIYKDNRRCYIDIELENTEFVPHDESYNRFRLCNVKTKNHRGKEEFSVMSIDDFIEIKEQCDLKFIDFKLSGNGVLEINFYDPMNKNYVFCELVLMPKKISFRWR